jgi:hypothetical protein
LDLVEGFGFDQPWGNGIQLEEGANSVFHLGDGAVADGLIDDISLWVEEEGLRHLSGVVLAALVAGQEGIDGIGDEIDPQPVANLQVGNGGGVFFAIATVIDVIHEEGRDPLLFRLLQGNAGGDHAAIGPVEGKDVAIVTVVVEQGAGGRGKPTCQSDEQSHQEDTKQQHDLMLFCGGILGDQSLEVGDFLIVPSCAVAASLPFNTDATRVEVETEERGLVCA